MIAHLGRLGGVIVQPQKTFAQLLWRDSKDRAGSVWELVPWMVLVAATVAPKQAGRVVLIGRMSLVDALSQFMGFFSQRMAFVLIGAVVLALLLVVVDRLRKNAPALTFDVAMDACAFSFVPFFVLASIGAGLSELGLELWFMPHRLLKGSGLQLVVRSVVAYGWPLVLFLLLLLRVWRGPDSLAHPTAVG